MQEWRRSRNEVETEGKAILRLCFYILFISMPLRLLSHWTTYIFISKSKNVKFAPGWVCGATRFLVCVALAEKYSNVNMANKESKTNCPHETEQQMTTIESNEAKRLPKNWYDRWTE